MKKLLCSIALTTAFMCLMVKSQAQAKVMFVELGGPGLASLNYDMRFTKSEKGIGGRVGIGYFGVNSGGDRVGVTTIPIGVNYLLGKNEKNYFELGAGFTPVIAKATSGNESERFTGSFGHLNFGYRLQPKDGGFVFRASINPIFGSGYFYPLYGGVSFGYKF